MFVDAVCVLVWLLDLVAADICRNKCDANAPYADIDAKDVAEGSDLTDLDWIKDSESYICFTELKALQRFVRMSRLIVTSSKDVTVDA